jgi:hypothetical protein
VLPLFSLPDFLKRNTLSITSAPGSEQRNNDQLHQTFRQTLRKDGTGQALFNYFRKIISDVKMVDKTAAKLIGINHRLDFGITRRSSRNFGTNSDITNGKLSAEHGSRFMHFEHLPMLSTHASGWVFSQHPSSLQKVRIVSIRTRI